jgi:hypothetical protein
LTLRLVALAIGFGGVRNRSRPMVGGARGVGALIEENGRITVHVSSVLVRRGGALVGFTPSPTVVGRYRRYHRITVTGSTIPPVEVGVGVVNPPERSA